MLATLNKEEKGEEEEGLQRRSRRTVRERKGVVASVAEDKEVEDEGRHHFLNHLVLGPADTAGPGLRLDAMTVTWSALSPPVANFPSNSSIRFETD